MPNSRTILALVLLVAGAACSGRNPSVAFAPYYDFAGLQTYDWAPKDAESGADLPYDDIDRAVKRVVDAHLTRAGFSRSSDNPSFLVNYWVGSEEVAQLTDDGYYAPGWGSQWGYGWAGPDGINVSQYGEGSVTIDFIATGPRPGLIWRGIAAAELDLASSGRIEGAISSAVASILEDFPPEVDR